MERLKKKYQEEVIPAMMKEFGYKNPLQVPRLEKITLNVGLGEAIQNIKVLDAAVSEVAAINGQKPVRDFRGVSDRSFDRRGNYSLGLREQIIFPEIQADKVEKARGLTVSIVTTAKTDQEGKALLKYMGMPFAS